ncbi:MAG TPA: hypothetical protein VLT36_09430 [Candidatus Dormibacteraeota bacterium]|nr:hypothetical protein [Candidatus Dormibacteraeota bacterium]
MNTLPVIERELRLRARQGATYWTRLAVAAVAAMIGLQELVLPTSSTAGGIGAASFAAVSWAGFLVACGSAFVTADTLCRERREGTLGLLLLTKLKSYDVVLGKLCAAGLTTYYALLGFVPALGIVVLVGGVSGWQFARTSLALLNGIFLALACGLWVSARAQTRSGAMRGTLLMLVLFCIVPRIAMNIGIFFTPQAEVLAALGPYSTFYLVSHEVVWNGIPLFWISLALVNLEAWVLLLWTALRLSRNWRAVEWAPKPRKVEWEPVFKEEAQALAESRSALLTEDPVCWAVSRMRIQNALLWVGTLLLLLGGTGFSWGMLIAGNRGSAAAIGIWDSLHLLSSLASAALLAWAAGRFLFEGQRNGELELLLSTPLGARDIIGGNWRALCRPLRGAWLLVAFLILIEVLTGAGAHSGLPIFQLAVAPVGRVLDIIALCWMGMWFGLTVRKPFAIIGWTVGLVVGLPWLVSYVFIITASARSGPGLGLGAQPLAFLFWFAFWPLLNLMKNIFFIRWAASRLRSELRATASLGAGEWSK